MIDPTPEELDAIVAVLRHMARRMSFQSRDVIGAKACLKAAAAITALRAQLAATDALIAAAYEAATGEAKDQERACAEWYQQTGKHAVLYDQFDIVAKRILALTPSSAREAYQAAIAAAERAGYERGMQYARKQEMPPKADLPPCPFCGGEAFLDTGFGPCARAVCAECGTASSWIDGADCEERARAEWSRRAPVMEGTK